MIPASKVSLLLISNSYPPVLGGSEIEAQRVCAALLRRGHRVTVVCAGGPPMPDVADWVDPAGVPVCIFARRGTGRRKDYTFALAVAWILFKERRHYQLVYFLMQGMHLATGLPVARWLGKPIVMKVSRNWAAEPLDSYEKALKFIRTTTTTTGSGPCLGNAAITSSSTFSCKGCIW